MSGEFLVWRPGSMKDGVCKLTAPEGIPRSYQIDRGVSRLATWKPGASSAMDPSFPRDLGLEDSLYGATFVVVSSRVRDALAGAQVGHIEYLPLTIVNHKGRVASRSHFILHPLLSIDCVDRAASVAMMNPVDPASMFGCARLVIVPSAVPTDHHVFRLKPWPGLVLVRRSLASHLRAAALTGLRFVEPNQYTGLF